jgi:hypothetical protein
MHYIIVKKDKQYSYPFFYSVTLHNNRPFFSFQIQLAEKYKTYDDAVKALSVMNKDLSCDYIISEFK